MNEATSNWTPDQPLWDSFQPVVHRPPVPLPRPCPSCWGPHLPTTWLSKGLITSVSPACDTITTCAQPSGLSPEQSAWPQHGVLTHSHGTLPQPKCALYSLSLMCMAVGKHCGVKSAALGGPPKSLLAESFHSLGHKAKSKEG